MDVPVRTISMFLVLFLGAYNLWPAIQRGEKVIVIFGVVGLIVFSALLNTMLTAFRKATNSKAHVAKDTFELFARPIPYRFSHEGRNYDTSEAKFLGGFKELGANYRGYTYHVHPDTKEAFCIEWNKMRGAGMSQSVHLTPEKHYGGYDVWYDGIHGYRHAIEDVYDRCGAEAANLVEQRLGKLTAERLKVDISSKTLGACRT